MKEAQSTNTILMVRPSNFGFNVETAADNAFQNEETNLTSEEIKAHARGEFDEMVRVLRAHDVDVIVIEDTATPAKTDAIFPNNWISTHQNGLVYTYPMYSPNRRLERRADIINHLSKRYDVLLNEELLSYEDDSSYLEGTGSMILDRPNKIIYACYSERTDAQVLKSYGDNIGYEVVAFDAVDDTGIPYYHTNVIMTLGTRVCIICTESIEDVEQRKRVINSLVSSDKQIVEITRDQVLHFAGNMLEVVGKGAKPLMIMSTAAHDSLNKDQLHIIENHNKIVHCGLDTIEHFGGGSARCMMAEIFLSEKD